jgi:hypothetical protein
MATAANAAMTSKIWNALMNTAEFCAHWYVGTADRRCRNRSTSAEQGLPIAARRCYIGV